MWQRNVRLYYIWSFVSSFMLLAAVLVPFFKNRGLSQFEIQSLQAIFQIMVFVMEVPTGVIGDWLGRKWSLVMGGVFSAIGLMMYAVVDGFWMFVGAEVLLAIGIAFKSGSDQALIYDSLKEVGEERRFGEIVSKARMLGLLGTVLGGLVGSWSLRVVTMESLVFLSGLMMLMGAGVSWLFREPSIVTEKESQRWHEVFVAGWRNLMKDKVLQWLVVYGAMSFGLGYFVIWLYQVRLGQLGVRVEYFGVFHALLTVLEIVWLGGWRRVLEKVGWKRLLVGLPGLMGIGYWVAAVWPSCMGVVVWFLLSGVLGLTSKEVLAVLMQARIESKVRATVMSFAGMMRSLVVALANPVVGWLVDWSVVGTLMILGGVGILGSWLGWKTAKVAVSE